MAQVKYIKDLYENEETSLQEISQAEYLIKREGLHVFVKKKVKQKGTKKLSEGSTCQRWSEQGCAELQQAPV